MVKFRELSISEEKLIKNDIDSNFGVNIFDSIRNRFQAIAKVGKKIEVFLVSQELKKYFIDLKEKKSLTFLGLHLGDISNKKFKINIAAFDLVSKLSKKIITVSPKGEQTALYGKNIPKKFIVSINPRAKKNELFLIQNQEKETVALGRLLFNSNLIEEQEPNQIIIKIYTDLGWYIRKGN